MIDAEQALRYLAYKAAETRDAAYRTRDFDKFEALCLLLPSVMRLCHLRPMDEYEAAEYHEQMKVLVKFPPTTQTQAGPDRSPARHSYE